MKIKKILFLIIIFLTVSVPISNADTEEVNLDFSKIADRFNKSYYTLALSDIGISLNATKVDNSFILTYNNSETVTYTYDSSTQIFSTTYSIKDDTKKDILSAIFADSISTLEGNEEGSFIFPMLNDTFCYTSIKSNGISKSYISNDGGTTNMTEFQISASKKLSPSLGTTAISKSNLNKAYDTFKSQENCIVKNDNSIILRTFDENGNTILYIGQHEKLLDTAYESVLNTISYIFSLNNDDEITERVVSYFKQNYSGFSNGNANFNGVSINVDINYLPVNTVDSILVSRNMKYAKITINTDTIIENSKNIAATASINDSVNISKERISPILNVSLGIIILVLIIMVAGLIARKHMD